jgi:hypothetical protein
MVAVLSLSTVDVVIVNTALVLPPATVTFAGTDADAELSLSETTTPPLGAAPLKVTVPWELVPPLTLVGFTVSVLNAGGLIVSEAVFASPP